jgi:hypothetical protein
VRTFTITVNRRSRLQRQLEREVRERFPGAPIQRVALLQHGDDPQVGPGALLGRVYLEAPGDSTERERALQAFHDTYRQAIRDLRDLGVLQEVEKLEFVVGDGGGEGQRDPVLFRRLGKLSEAPEAPATALVPVMARLGPAELETVDTLITAGIAANRAEAIRWALARIRERPAYQQIRQHAREIAELKDQF